MIRPIFAAAATFLIATPALAKSDLDVSIPTPAAVHVYSSNTYDVVVANVGNRNADNVQVAITLPVTNTSPVVHVLGDLGAVDGRCTLSGTMLLCNLGRIRRNRSETISFDIELPEAAKVLTIAASATTSSSENTTSNNDAAVIPNLLNYATVITDDDSGHVRHCTGTNLTSFFECELYSSSLMSHDIDFAGTGSGTIDFNPPQPGFSGDWSQTASDQLSMTYYAGTDVVVEFEGYGTSPGCFEGVATFPGSTYVGIYEVCI